MDAGRFIQASKARNAHEQCKACMAQAQYENYDVQEQRFSEPIEVSYLPKSISIGIIKKELLYKNDNPSDYGDIKEIAILTLEPGAEILEHQHVNDMEYYIDTCNSQILVCNCGESHAYANYQDKWISIVSIKLAVKV